MYTFVYRRENGDYFTATLIKAGDRWFIDKDYQIQQKVSPVGTEFYNEHSTALDVAEKMCRDAGLLFVGMTYTNTVIRSGRVQVPDKPLTTCQADGGGDCNDDRCPQMKSRKSHCPLPDWTDSPEY